MEIELRADYIRDYLDVCSVASSELILNKFFMTKDTSVATRRAVCNRFLTKMVERSELYRIRSSGSRTYLYSNKQFSKNKPASTYTRMALESDVLSYFEQLGYACSAVRRDFSLQKGFRIPCILWLKKSNLDEFFIVEVANTPQKVTSTLDTYNYMYTSGIYKSAFSEMPIVIIKTNCKVNPTLIEVIRVP